MIIHKIKKINFVIFYNDLYIPLNSNNGEKSIETPRLGILIFEKAYAIIAIGEKK